MPALWMIVASFLFACMGVCVKLGAAWFAPDELVFYRGLTNIVMMVAIARATQVALSTPNWRLHLARSLSGATALGGYFFSISSLPLATAVTFNYTSPLFVALLLIVRFGERPRPLALAMLALGFASIVLLLRPTLGADMMSGALAGIIGGALASVAYVSVRELGRAGEPEVRVVFWFSCVTALFGLGWALATVGLNFPREARAWLTVLGVGLFGGIAQLAMTRAYSAGHTVVSACLSYSTVIFASIFGMLWWDEQHDAASWLAMALIIASGIGVSLAARPPAARSSL